MKFAIIVSDTNRKLYNVSKPLSKKDLRSSLSHLESRYSELRKYKIQAEKMFVSNQQRFIMDGVNKLRRKYGRELFELYYLSSGYGIIKSHFQIYPYNININQMNKDELYEWSSFLRIPSTFQEIVKDYKMVFILLNKNQLTSLQINDDFKTDAKLLFFLSRSSLASISVSDYRNEFVVIGRRDIERLNQNYNTIKGYVLKKLCDEIVINKNFLKDVYDNDNYLIDFVSKLDCESKDNEKKQLQFMFS